MDYDAIAAHFLIPGTDTPPSPRLPRSDARRLRDALEPVATIGWWSREASSAVTALGHDFFDGYVWGRAASLGADVDPSIVVAAFGVFEPSMIAAVYAHGRSVSTREAVLTARADGAAHGLSAATVGVPESIIAQVGDNLLDALRDLDSAGRPLFSALRALPTPVSAHGRVWRAAELVREHRGDGHIAAFVAAGLTAIEINVLTEVWLEFDVGEYSSTRAFPPDRITETANRLGGLGLLDASRQLTDTGRSLRNQIEAATDDSQSALVAALGDDLAETIVGAERISAAVLAAQAAPADPRKRAAG